MKRQSKGPATKADSFVGCGTSSPELSDLCKNKRAAAIEKGEKPLKPIEKKVRQRESQKKQAADKPKFNTTNDNIEWALYSWDPVTGCKFGCKYCYARDIAIRFSWHFNPEFHPERLEAPKNTTVAEGKPNNGFVCLMADLFGDWVSEEWIEQTVKAVSDNPQWDFLFLTKIRKDTSNSISPKTAGSARQPTVRRGRMTRWRCFQS